MCAVRYLGTNPLRVPDDAVSLTTGALLVFNTPVTGDITHTYSVENTATCAHPARAFGLLFLKY